MRGRQLSVEYKSRVPVRGLMTAYLHYDPMVCWSQLNKIFGTGIGALKSGVGRWNSWLSPQTPPKNLCTIILMFPFLVLAVEVSCVLISLQKSHCPKSSHHDRVQTFLAAMVTQHPRVRVTSELQRGGLMGIGGRHSGPHGS